MRGAGRYAGGGHGFAAGWAPGSASTAAEARGQLDRADCGASASSSCASANKSSGRSTPGSFGSGGGSSSSRGRHSGGASSRDGRGDREEQDQDGGPGAQEPAREEDDLAKLLDQTDDEEEAEAEVPAEGGDEMALAIAKLTAIAENLALGKKKASSFENLLEGSGSADASGLGASGRRNAAALKVLRRALQDHPKELAEGIMDRMAADFGLAKGLPGEDKIPVTARAWIETRARLQHHYPSTIRFAWILGGIIDSLNRLWTIEQFSLDRGSWTLAEPMLLEAPAPVSSFHGRQMPVGSELPFTKLMDARAVELLMYQVREVDDYLERRRRLGVRKPGVPGLQETQDPDDKETGGNEGKGKGRGKAKAKAPASKTESA